MKYNEEQLKKLTTALFSIYYAKRTAMEKLDEGSFPDYAKEMVVNAMTRELLAMYGVFKVNLDINDVLQNEDLSDIKIIVAGVYESVTMEDLPSGKLFLLEKLFNDDSAIEDILTTDKDMMSMFMDYVDMNGPSTLKDDSPSEVGDSVMFVEEHAVNFLVSAETEKLVVEPGSEDADDLAERLYGKECIVTSITKPITYKCGGCDNDHVADIRVKFKDIGGEFAINNLLLTRYVDTSIDDI